MLQNVEKCTPGDDGTSMAGLQRDSIQGDKALQEPRADHQLEKKKSFHAIFFPLKHGVTGNM